MKTKLTLIATATVLLSPLCFADSGPYLSAGFTEIHDGDSKQPAATATLGYSHPVSPFIFADVSYTTTLSGGATFDNADGSSTVLKYNTYNVGLKLEQDLGGFVIVNGRAGGSYSQLEKTTITTSSQDTSTDSSFRPYASIGADIPSPVQENLRLKADVIYQQLAVGYYTINYVLGASLLF